MEELTCLMHKAREIWAQYPRSQELSESYTLRGFTFGDCPFGNNMEGGSFMPWPHNFHTIRIGKFIFYLESEEWKL